MRIFFSAALGLALFTVAASCGQAPQQSNETVVPDANAKALLEGTFVPSKVHAGKGAARIEQSASGALRLVLGSDFEVDNGPALVVYLSKKTSMETSGFAVDALKLGNIKGVRGEQAYGIAAGTDLSAYRAVIVWCDSFSVLFTIADLAAPK
jgi:Electron transfer DM13